MMVGNIIRRYPSNPITPHGAYWFLSGKKPMMTYRSYDDKSVFHLMGGMSIPDPANAPESIRVQALSGLIAPWAPIEQKGATQDGSTFIDALYDPIDCDMLIQIKGKTAQRTQQIVRDWIAAWDARKPGELSFFDQYAGRWWAPVRWTRNPVDKLLGGNFTKQTFTWPFKSHDAFWRSYDNTDEFRFTPFNVTSDEFADLTRWTLAYSGSGLGTVAASPERADFLATILGPGEMEAKWVIGGNDQGRTVVARRRKPDTTVFTTSTDFQVASVTLGSFPAWNMWDEAYNDIWLRLNETGTAGTSGIRLRIQLFSVELSYFVAGVETTLRSKIILPAYPGETWTLMAGVGDNPRAFKVLRGKKGQSEVMTVVENGTGSLYGTGNRALGWGMESGTGASNELPPADYRRWYGGDNVTQTQEGMLRRINMGDQPMWDRYTLHGPGTFFIGSGPGSTDKVKFGPLERGQVVQIRADPRKRAVVDLTSVQPSPQQLAWWQQAMKDFVSFASGNNASPLEETILSKFGVKPPQGNLYALLDGRFTKPIPAKPTAGPAQVYNVLVEVVGGDSDTRIVAAGTPLRRWPL